MEDVVLEIERPVGELDQNGARHEGVQAGGEEPEPGPTAVRLAPRVNPSLESRQLLQSDRTERSIRLGDVENALAADRKSAARRIAPHRGSPLQIECVRA